MNIGPFYLNLVKKFIMDIPKGFNDAGRSDYRKVHVRGHCFGFSSAIVNNYLRRERLITDDRVPSLKTIAQEITRNIHDD